MDREQVQNSDDACNRLKEHDSNKPVFPMGKMTDTEKITFLKWELQRAELVMRAFDPSGGDDLYDDAVEIWRALMRIDS